MPLARDALECLAGGLDIGLIPELFRDRRIARLAQHGEGFVPRGASTKRA